MKINKQILKESLLNIIKEDYKNPTDTVVKLLQRNNLVKESIQPINESERGLMVFGHSRSDTYAIQQFIDDSDLHAEWDARYGYFLFPEEEDNYDELELEISKQLDKLNINYRIEGIFENMKNNKKLIKEAINSQWVLALKEIVDDLQMHTEMLINERYGRDDLNTFKEKWYKITLQFDKKFGNMLKNLKR